MVSCPKRLSDRPVAGPTASLASESALEINHLWMDTSLNLKMLFIPEDLIRYALIHELCHTEHLNHSREFWALLKHHEPDYTKKDEKLRSAWLFVPAWLDANKMRGENGGWRI